MSMESQENIHYRVGGRLTHCGVECLPQGKDIPRIIIERIEYKEREMINGRTEEGVWVAHFAQNPYTKLPLILNATNRKRIVKQFPECEGYLARLKNIPVRLTKEKCRDVQDGGETWGLRISKLPAAQDQAQAPASAQAPAQSVPQKKTITEDKIDAIVVWAKNNGLSIEQIGERYNFASDAVRDAIADAIVDDMPDE